MRQRPRGYRSLGHIGLNAAHRLGPMRLANCISYGASLTSPPTPLMNPKQTRATSTSRAPPTHHVPSSKAVISDNTGALHAPPAVPRESPGGVRRVDNVWDGAARRTQADGDHGGGSTDTRHAPATLAARCAESPHTLHLTPVNLIKMRKNGNGTKKSDKNRHTYPITLN